MNFTISDGVTYRTLISCHRNGTFSYHDGNEWVRNAKTVPRVVLDDLPEDERLRVRGRMAEEGQVPS